MTSIIIPCWNQWEFTELCVQALFRHTRSDWELIVVDNGSSDHTAAYLAGVRDAARVPVTIIRNAQNAGFPRAINQGLQAARGEYLVLLNNDAVVTGGWLDQLIALTAARVGSEDRETCGPDRGGDPSGARRPAPNSDRPPHITPTIGLVGPMSNYATPPQLIETVPYRDLDAMQEFARRWRDEHRGKWFTVAKLSGFCLLMTRAVYDSVGGLDERFGLGLFDDDDLAERARRAGFALAVAHDLFVHHFGSRTFAGNGIDASALLEENARRFAAKWGPDRPRGRRVALRPFEPHSTLDSRSRIPDSRFQIPEPKAQSPEPKAQSPEPKAQSPEPKAQSPEPKAQSPEPRTQSPEPKAQSPEPKAQSPEPKTQSPEPRTQSPEPRTQSPEPRTQSPEPRAQSPEPRAQSPEPRAQNPKPKAQNPKPRAQNPKPRAQSPEPRAQNPKPRAQSPEPRAKRACWRRILGRSTIGAITHRLSGAKRACWRRILGLRRPEQFASLDMGIYGHLTRRNLAVLAHKRGDPEEAARLWRAVLAERPGDREAVARLERFPQVVDEEVEKGNPVTWHQG